MWRGADRGRSQMILTEYRYDPKSKDSKSIYRCGITAAFIRLF